MNAPRLSLVLTVVAAAALAGCGGDDSESQEGGTSPAAETVADWAASPEAKAVAEIRDRAVAAGYDLTPCTDLPEDEAGCLDEITVSADGAGLFINLYGSGAPVAAEGAEQRYGVLHPGYDILFVDANSTPEGLRSSIEALRDSAKEKSAIEQGRAVYVVIDNRVWSVAGGGPV